MLHGFAFGEHLEGTPPRSLGFRLLAPAAAGWAAEVETLARRLQAAPYPDHWPPVELFCSVLLADGQRLVAVARYGLVDHTPSRRRGGLELVGIVGPGSLGVPEVLAVYRWLRQRRAATDDLRSLGGQHALDEVLGAAPSAPAASDAVPVLPIRLWQPGAMLFAATAPADPDLHLGLLEQNPAGNWQWLPYVGADFPLPGCAQRGPLVAWTPHLAGVAVKLDHKPDAAPPRAPARRRAAGFALSLLALLLLAANLWAMLRLYSRPVVVTLPQSADLPPGPVSAVQPSDESGREQFARALHRALQRRHVTEEWSTPQFLEEYARLAAEDEQLRVSNPDAKATLGAVGLLARRRAGRVEALVREALSNKGFDAELVNLACRRVRERLAAEPGDGR
jgi:hypothetical protein